ncbi:streptophobe family protein [Streptomyces sp. DSM 41529]|uniref:Streptophobe family protein n=1 Tax=Streptomyces lonegramiae TaxID=3075524 RepID=A0ABU2XWG4_9ACTN|nr:streptophobe family protein [Streptomyces sp. DSM 41529]MDT0550267.1 streptophobe family protein [Streptomyces sp. DSM 41529]
MGASGGGRARPGEVLLAAVAAVSWAFLAMAGVAALGLHLVGADGAGALGPMTAAAVVLAAGGSVIPSGDVEAFGLQGAQAHSAIDVVPLGIGLVGALLLGWVFVRSLRGAGAVIGGAELAARAGAVALLFLLVLAGLTWVGNDTVTIDAASLGLKGKPEQEGLLGKLPGELGDIADIGSGLLPDRIQRLIDAKAAVGFTVEAGRSVLGGAVWVVAVLLIAVLVARRAPMPRGLEAAHRTVRPAASALYGVLVLAVGAGLAAALYAAIGDDHPRLVLGSALLGAPNGVWLGVPLGLFVPWHGGASGALVRVLPDPLDKLLADEKDEPITVARLAELDGRVWLLAVACVLMILAAGVLTAVRTPVGRTSRAGFVGRCALWLGIVTALTLPLLVRLTGVSAGASLSVLGFDAFGAGIELHGNGPAALALGAGWGAAAGAAGALAAWATGAAGGQASRFALDSARGPAHGSAPGSRLNGA